MHSPEQHSAPPTKTPPRIPLEAFKFPSGNTLREPRTFRWVLITLIVLLVLVLAGLLTWLYLLQQTPTTPPATALRPTAEENNEPESSTAEAAAVTQQTLSPSTELASIENDLRGTQPIDLEPLFVDIEAMF